MASWKFLSKEEQAAEVDKHIVFSSRSDERIEAEDEKIIVLDPNCDIMLYEPVFDDVVFKTDEQQHPLRRHRRVLESKEKALGHGSFGQVWILNKHFVFKKKFDVYAMDAAKTEVEVLCKIRNVSPYLMNIAGYTTDFAYIILPRYSLSLEDASTSPTIKIKLLADKKPQLLCEQIASGLISLWRCGYRHGDTRPPNILLNANLTKAVITDFGNARPLANKQFQFMYNSDPTSAYESLKLFLSTVFQLDKERRFHCVEKSDMLRFFDMLRIVFGEREEYQNNDYRPDEVNRLLERANREIPHVNAEDTI